MNNIFRCKFGVCTLLLYKGCESVAREYNKRCNFYDVTIYKKTGERYINITDFDPFGKSNEVIQVESDSEYLVIYENFLTLKSSRTDEAMQLSEISEQELLLFAGFEKSETARTLHGKEKVVSGSKYCGLICAEAICGTGFHKRIIVKDNVALIQHRKTISGKQEYHTILSLEIRYKKIKYGK